MNQLDLKSVGEILEFAIHHEQKAADMYMELAKKSSTVDMRTQWEELAADEIKHKSILENILDNYQKGDEACCFDNCELPDYQPLDVVVGEISEADKALIKAIHRDTDTVEMYKYLSKKVNDELCANTLLTIANQELKHKQSLLKELSER
jgi:rubrerythrin